MARLEITLFIDIELMHQRQATLKHGIENLLRHYIPEVLEVRPVAA